MNDFFKLLDETKKQGGACEKPYIPSTNSMDPPKSPPGPTLIQSTQREIRFPFNLANSLEKLFKSISLNWKKKGKCWQRFSQGRKKKLEKVKPKKRKVFNYIWSAIKNIERRFIYFQLIMNLFVVPSEMEMIFHIRDFFWCVFYQEAFHHIYWKISCGKLKIGKLTFFLLLHVGIESFSVVYSTNKIPLSRKIHYGF